MKKKMIDIVVAVLVAVWETRMRVVYVVVAGCALGAIAHGASSIYKPLGFLVPGLLVWYDLGKGE